MYSRNNFLTGIFAFIAFVVAVNSFFADATYTAQNIPAFLNWLNNSGIAEGLQDLLINLRLFLYTHGIFIILAIAAIFIYRR